MSRGGSGSALVKVMSCGLMAQSHYLHFFYLIVSWTFASKNPWNFYLNNGSGNKFCDIASTHDLQKYQLDLWEQASVKFYCRGYELTKYICRYQGIISSWWILCRGYELTKYICRYQGIISSWWILCRGYELTKYICRYQGTISSWWILCRGYELTKYICRYQGTISSWWIFCRGYELTKYICRYQGIISCWWIPPYSHQTKWSSKYLTKEKVEFLRACHPVGH